MNLGISLPEMRC